MYPPFILLTYAGAMYNAGQSCCAVEVNGTLLATSKWDFD